MPIVRVDMLEGRTLEQKRNMVKKVTEAIAETLDAPKEGVSVVIRELKHEHLGIGGVLRYDV